MAFHLQEIYTNYGNGCRAALFQPYLRLRLKPCRLWWWTNGVTCTNKMRRDEMRCDDAQTNDLTLFFL